MAKAQEGARKCGVYTYIIRTADGRIIPCVGCENLKNGTCVRRGIPVVGDHFDPNSPVLAQKVEKLNKLADELAPICLENPS